MTLGERVKAVRQNAGLSQSEFAQSVSASRDMIANIEADRVTNLAAKKPLLQLICDEYNVNSDWLICGAEIERKIKENLNKLTYRQLIHILSIIPDKSQEAGN